MTNWYKYRVTGQTTDGKTETRIVIQTSGVAARLAYYSMVKNIVPETRESVCLGRAETPAHIKEKQKMLQGLEKVFNPDITVIR